MNYQPREDRPSIDMIGPFHEQRLVIDGWQVPFVDAFEYDDGSVCFTLDKRLGFTVGPADFEQAARLLANGIAIALGMGSHPNGEMTWEDREREMGRVHPLLRPKRLIGLSGPLPEHVHDHDDPRDHG